jgi:catechol 2,3-dioxygenase-like lactoylglutathione lyase family enzyme
MPIGYDHIVIAVEDLDRTVADYTSAGFRVTPGGEHKHGISHNALVTFADGAYFELIAFRNGGEGHGTHWPATLARGEGFVDYALRTEDLADELQALRAGGLAYSDPKDGGRIRPDGERVDWQTIRAGKGSGGPARLPFYCHDLTERSLRVPGGEAATHENGVTGIAGVSVVVADLDAAAAEFAALTGDAGRESQSTVPDTARARRYPLGRSWIEVIEPIEGLTNLRTCLESRGEVPYQVTLTGPDSGLLPLDLTHGAMLLIAADTDAHA